ncbi:unnamed protein product [Aphanomyces euteiches]|uniref:rhamnogalacturonan endolyase n=1 Tax=Aphanomyces euteiches TaxID=100861 RepID=A0A6G0WFB5_9STRA|nr:hypothetical protein Ae201684_015633 [Aphanomyces euteiches]KAH9094245.1 hypothetical protein Ae201684P_016857 [Aphanomyces euteiches]KAH9143309.1 hypothetical protein AeRB84_012680 [Aphanomyces euteiches]
MLAQVVCKVMATLLAVNYATAQTFGFTTSSDSTKWVINTGKGLSLTMIRASCDISSLKYNGQELQYSSQRTHVNSGLGSVSSQIALTTVGSTQTIQVTCSKTGLTQYYFFRANENAMYMGTYHSSDLVLPELRFLARLDRSTVPTGITEATQDSSMSAIEAEDIYATTANITRSKYYSAVPFYQDQIHGVRGSKAGVYFVMSDRAYETSSGGPFFRDINNKVAVANELTFYMNSDHTRTEDYRYGFHGPYALVFTDGPAPTSTSVVNFDFFQGLKLQGFVPDSQRGRVQGTINDPKGVLASSNVVVGFKNANAQYWTQIAAGGKLTYQSPLMKPGQYTMTIYKKQLAVGTANVAVSTTVATTNIAVAYPHDKTALWTIGEWDGTPDGFLNADKIQKMHLSDARMTSFKPLTFTVGKNVAADFPLALFRGTNDPLVISFQLTSQQAAQAHVLNIGVTLAQSNARPSVAVNNWNGPVLTTSAVKTRGITRGVTTGNYALYTYNVPASAFVAGANKISLTIASGSPDPAEKFLAASVVFDALELI